MIKQIACLFCLFITTTLYAQKSKYQLVWSDEFNYNGLPDSTKWNYDVGGHGWGNNELQYYTNHNPKNAFVANGKLTIQLLKEKKENRHYTSARLVTKGKGDFMYGKFFGIIG